MLAYWEIATLHNQLHYATYAKRYCETALNIAERINDKKIALAARNMLESLVHSWFFGVFVLGFIACIFIRYK